MTSFFCRGWSDLDKISQTGAEWHVDCSDMAEIETRSRIPIWRTFGRIQWRVISEPPAILQGAATWRIQCHDPRVRVTLQGAATWRIHWHAIPEPRVTLQGRPTATWWIHCHASRATRHIVGCKNSIRHIENCFSPCFVILFIFVFLMQFGLWRAAAFVSSPVHLFLLMHFVHDGVLCRQLSYSSVGYYLNFTIALIRMIMSTLSAWALQQSTV